ncbi:similar to deubiquitinating enzyme 3 [Ectocarpus siliculosus]|uniref:ubiquitinyl hydrolase 1 n=1 Tax=Ectocarpus siliculosus TaxID=2880 RepID=D7FSR8_ECTSI|nr:similar to deubiquitinating enzyme 3 [Ectocarpus siliculosus]|eukprot:CBJ31209.1 similar to deubiquitinating enzyme 3 [Ectocarpus siliculosus]
MVKPNSTVSGRDSPRETANVGPAVFTEGEEAPPFGMHTTPEDRPLPPDHPGGKELVLYQPLPFAVDCQCTAGADGGESREGGLPDPKGGKELMLYQPLPFGMVVQDTAGADGGESREGGSPDPKGGKELMLYQPLPFGMVVQDTAGADGGESREGGSPDPKGGKEQMLYQPLPFGMIVQDTEGADGGQSRDAGSARAVVSDAIGTSAWVPEGPPSHIAGVDSEDGAGDELHPLPEPLHAESVTLETVLDSAQSDDNGLLSAREVSPALVRWGDRRITQKHLAVVGVVPAISAGAVVLFLCQWRSRRTRLRQQALGLARQGALRRVILRDAVRLRQREVSSFWRLRLATATGVVTGLRAQGERAAAEHEATRATDREDAQEQQEAAVAEVTAVETARRELAETALDEKCEAAAADRVEQQARIEKLEAQIHSTEESRRVAKELQRQQLKKIEKEIADKTREANQRQHRQRQQVQHLAKEVKGKHKEVAATARALTEARRDGAYLQMERDGLGVALAAKEGALSATQDRARVEREEAVANARRLEGQVKKLETALETSHLAVTTAEAATAGARAEAEELQGKLDAQQGRRRGRLCAGCHLPNGGGRDGLRPSVLRDEIAGRLSSAPASASSPVCRGHPSSQTGETGFAAARGGGGDGCVQGATCQTEAGETGEGSGEGDARIGGAVRAVVGLAVASGGCAATAASCPVTAGAVAKKLQKDTRQWVLEMRDGRKAKKQGKKEEKKRREEESAARRRRAQKSQPASAAADTPKHGGGESAGATAIVKPKAARHKTSDELAVLAFQRRRGAIHGNGGTAGRRPSVNTAGFGVGVGSVLQKPSVAAAAVATAATTAATSPTADPAATAATVNTAATATASATTPADTAADTATPATAPTATDAAPPATAATANTAATAPVDTAAAPTAAAAVTPTDANTAATTTTTQGAALSSGKNNSEISGGASSGGAKRKPPARPLLGAPSKRGLQNSSSANLCCVNAVLQLLRHCPQLREGLSAYPRTFSATNAPGNSSTRAAKEKREKQLATRGMAMLMKRMDIPSRRGACHVHPSLANYIYNEDDLQRGQQGDAHLILMKLLDALSVASESGGTVSSGKDTKEHTLTVPLLSADGNGKLPGDVKALLTKKFATTSLSPCYACQGLDEVRAHKGEWLEMLRHQMGGTTAVSESVEAPQTAEHACLYDIVELLLDQTMAMLSPRLEGESSARRQTMESAASRLRPILRSGGAEDAIETTLGGGVVDDAMILLLEGITLLAQTTREEAPNQRAAEYVRRISESLKGKAQHDSNVGLSSMEEQSWLKKCPRTVLLYLMRFAYTTRGEKLTHDVYIPKEIDMAPYIGPPTTRAGARQPDMYDLNGVVHHIGQTTNKGHYVAFVRLPGEGWLRYDDAKVTGVTDSDVRTQNALILSYTRRSG